MLVVQIPLVFYPVEKKMFSLVNWPATKKRHICTLFVCRPTAKSWRPPFWRASLENLTPTITFIDGKCGILILFLILENLTPRIIIINGKLWDLSIIIINGNLWDPSINRNNLHFQTKKTDYN